MKRGTMHLTIPLSALDSLQNEGKARLRNERGDTVIIELDAVEPDSQFSFEIGEGGDAP